MTMFGSGVSCTLVSRFGVSVLCAEFKAEVSGARCLGLGTTGLGYCMSPRVL